MKYSKGKLHIYDEDYPRIDICAPNSYMCSMTLEKENTREQGLEDARRIVALWNAAAELELDTEQIERGIIDDAFTALKEKVDEELYASYMKEMTP